MPMKSLHRASKTWLMDVGAMLLWPWKKPRKAEMMQMKNTDGAKTAMAAQEVSKVVCKTDSCRQKRSIPRLPTMPMHKKTLRDTEKIFWIWEGWFSAWASEIMRLMATGRPVVEIIKSTE